MCRCQDPSASDDALETGEGSLDHGSVDAIGDAEIPGHAEAASGHDKDELFLQRPHECKVIPAGCFREDVERPLRHGELVAHRGERIADSGGVRLGASGFGSVLSWS